VEVFSAIVLAGGRSSRMGTDKAALAWNGATMIQRTVAELGRRFEDVIVIAGASQAGAMSLLSGTDARVIFDRQPFQGPVTALHLGLNAVKGDVAFACGCDLPFLNSELAQALCVMAAGYDAAIPMIQGRLQVLHGAYHRNAAAKLQAMIEAGRQRRQEVVALLRARVVNEDELRRYDQDLLSFFNVNTPADFERALQLKKSKT